MDEKQYQNFKKVIKSESKTILEKFIAMEVDAQPDNSEFLTGLLKSEFFVSFFERGFIEGIAWQKKNKNTKFIL